MYVCMCVKVLYQTPPPPPPVTYICAAVLLFDHPAVAARQLGCEGPCVCRHEQRLALRRQQ